MNQRISNEQRHTRFWCLFSFLLVSLFLRYALQINIPRLGFLVIIAMIAFLGTQTEILAICICLIPLHESVDFYYSIVVCTAVYILKFYRRIRINLTVILVLFMVVWELIHCFHQSFSLVIFVTSLVPLIALSIIMSSDLSSVDYDFIVRVLALSTAATCITLFGRVLYLSDFNLFRAITNLRRLGITWDESEKSRLLSGGEINPNGLGIINVLASTGLLQLRSVKRNHRTDIVLLTILLVFGSLTSSRTFLFCLLLMIFLMVIGQQGNLRHKIRFMGSIVAIILLAFFLLSQFFPDLLGYFFGRFQESDITTGRDDLMRVYHDFIVGTPKILFFGIGLQNYGYTLTDIYHVAQNIPHNSIQEIIIAWGVPGLLLILSLIFTIIRRSRKHVPCHTLLNYIPLVIILFKSMAGQLLTSGYSMLALSYAYLSLCQNFQATEQS